MKKKCMILLLAAMAACGMVSGCAGIEKEISDKSEEAAAEDILGSYNGCPISGAGNDWSIFGDDGWEFDSEDEEYDFMSASNNKYRGACLRVYNYSRTGASRYGIMKYGFFGYDMDCRESEDYPPVTWNGVTFGADMDEVISAYGKHGGIKDCGGYETCTYQVAYNVQIVFYIYPDEGLQRVNVISCGGNVDDR